MYLSAMSRHISIVNLKGSFVAFYAVRPAFFLYRDVTSFVFL